MKKVLAPMILAASVAFTAVPSANAMTQELNSMTGALVNALTAMTLSPGNVGSLTLAEINTINLIMNSGDSESEKRQKIKAILDN